MISRSLLVALLLLTGACAELPKSGTLESALAPRANNGEWKAFGVEPIRQTDADQANVGQSAQHPGTAAQGVIIPALEQSLNVRPTRRPSAASVNSTMQMRIREMGEETAAADQPVADESPSSRDLWVRVRKGFRMAPFDNNLVRDWENWYSSRPDYVARMIERSSRFLFHVVEEVERRKMPLEVALLPMIESAYNPVAYSTSHASGIWQFIPSTGKHYGLRQNFWYDGRRDVIAATGAALDYLEKLHGMFNNWELALASYNWGEGAVSRAVARNQARGLPGDYESLSMPAETRNYIPKLIAVKNIISDPARFGLTLQGIPNEPYFGTVMVKHHIDVKLAAKLAEMSIEDFKFLNPAHNKPVINSNLAEVIVLPRQKVSVFQTNLMANDKPLVSYQAYTVKAGERPEKIAARHGMTLAQLQAMNGLSTRNKISTGQPLLVPTRADAVEAADLPDIPATPVSLAKAVKTVKVAGTKHGPVVRKVAELPHPARTGKKLAVAGPKNVKVVTRKAPAPARKAAAPAAPAAPPSKVKLASAPR